MKKSLCYLFFIIPILLACALWLLLGCTYNVSFVSTDGTASDVVDTSQRSDAQPNISVPLPPFAQ